MGCTLNENTMSSQQTHHKTIAIIGAGAAGLTAAYQLSKAGYSVSVFEASPQIGGLARSIPLWNQTVDLGPHRFFSNDKRINSLWLEVAGKDYVLVDRLTRIYYKNRYFHYPLKPVDALKKLGLLEACRCMLSYIASRLRTILKSRHNKIDSFEQWVTARFGKRLFEIFFKTYSEKLWGIGCHELDADFAAQRIKKLTLLEAIKDALSITSKNKHKTLVDRFAYPTQGTGMVYERMAEKVQQNGGSVHLQTAVTSINYTEQAKPQLTLSNGETQSFDHIISTMPITLLLKALPSVPQPVLLAAKQLTFRNTILVFLKVEASDLFPDNWLYIHSDNLKMGRITNFRNWAPSLYQDEQATILSLEYWCYKEDPEWQLDNEQLINQAKQEIRQTGLIGEAAITAGHVEKLPRCYPVYKTGYKAHMDTIIAHLQTLEWLTLIGRYGSFKYNNQDHSILMGMLAAENLIHGSAHDLWEINTDYENYQESSVITETGLQ